MGFARGCRRVCIGPRRARTLRIERGAGFPEQERSETTEHEQCTRYHERGRAPPASTTAPITDMISMNTFSLFSNHFLTTPGPVEVAIHNESP